MSITLSSSDPFVLGIFEEFAKINHLPATIAVLDNTVVELVQDPDVYKSIQDEVAQLAKTLCDLENGFATVERHLHRIDNKKAVEIDGKPRVYAPEWRTLHDVSLHFSSHARDIIRDLFFEGIHPTHAPFSVYG